MVEEEAVHYETKYRMYTCVRPGITGLWKISDRSDANYGFRVRMDEYYARNWSIWLDIDVLASTPWVVLTRRGA